MDNMNPYDNLFLLHPSDTIMHPEGVLGYGQGYVRHFGVFVCVELGLLGIV